MKREELICMVCLSDLPLCRFSSLMDNAAARQFWGRVKLEFVLCYCFHTGTGVFPQLLHHLKYRACPEVGVLLGSMFGSDLKKTLKEQEADWLIPVPLHPSKQRKRGYNQSEKIAIGISSMSEIPVKNDWLIRTRRGKSQTKKNRLSRVQESRSLFELELPDAFQSDHFVIVDDVITTGATMEVCVELFERYPDCRVSVLSLAYTWS